MPAHFARLFAACSCVWLLATVGCSNPATDPLPTTPTARSTENFSGTLEPSGSQVFNFFAASGTTDITLVSLRPAGANAPTLSVPLLVAFGSFADSVCTVLTQTTSSPGLTAALSVPTTPSQFCVQVTDQGQLKETVSFTVRIIHP